MPIVDVKARGGDPIINLTLPGPSLLGDTKRDFHASFNGNQGIWGCGPDVDIAAGDCLRTASSLSEITGFSLPENFRDKSNKEIGEAAWSGRIPGIDVRRSDNG